MLPRGLHTSIIVRVGGPASGIDIKTLLFLCCFHGCRQKLLDLGLHVLGDWDSPVMPIMVYHLGYLGGISRKCLERHIALVVVGFPATALLESRCRVCISASHSRADLDYALDVLRDVLCTMRLQYSKQKNIWGLLRLLVTGDGLGNDGFAGKGGLLGGREGKMIRAAAEQKQRKQRLRPTQQRQQVGRRNMDLQGAKGLVKASG